MSAALLLGDYERAASLGPESPTAELGRATALFLSGEHRSAFERLDALGEREGSAAAQAARLVEDPLLWPEQRFEREWRSFQMRRALGWIGGPRLSVRCLFERRHARSVAVVPLGRVEDILQVEMFLVPTSLATMMS